MLSDKVNFQSSKIILDTEQGLKYHYYLNSSTSLSYPQCLELSKLTRKIKKARTKNIYCF